VEYFLYDNIEFNNTLITKNKRCMNFYIKLVTFVLVSFSVLLGQPLDYISSETGQPFLKYYNSKTYNLSADNWKVIQDHRGIMYFGNEKGVLEFDGNSWRKISVSNSAFVRSMTIADDGTIYVCASTDFGYLGPDSLGQLYFHSLRSYLAKEDLDYGEVWDVSASSENVYFKTKDKIFRWNGHQISIIDSVNAFRLYRIGDTIYSRNDGVGLMIVDEDSMRLMPGGEFFASTGVFNMLPFSDRESNTKNKILVTTNMNGLFLYDGTKFSPFKTQVDSFLIKNQVYNACITCDGYYAFATQRGGVVIIDTKGNLVRFINEDSGLPTNVVYDIYSDRSGGLWLATANGIVYCEQPSPFSIFQKNGSLNDMSNGVVRYDGTIYVANEMGVLYLSDKSSTFQLIEGSNKPAYNFLKIDDRLLAGTNWGTVAIEKNRIKNFVNNTTTNCLLKSKMYQGRIYAGTRDGLSVCQKLYNGVFKEVYIKDTVDEVYSVVEENDGSLWLAGYFSGIFHVNGNLEGFTSGSDKNVTYKFYSKENGLPGNEWRLYDVEGKMLLATDMGVFRFDMDSEKFFPDTTLGKNLSDSNKIILLVEKSINGDLWILTKKEENAELGKAVLQVNGSYKWEPYSVFKRLDIQSIRAIYSDSDLKSNKEIVWLSTEEALVCYNPEIEKNIENNYSTLIRKVSVHNDSVIFGGMHEVMQTLNGPTLPAYLNDINFEFSAMNYDKPEETQYQYFLEGYDHEWSRWKDEPRKEYTNLSGGEYIFRVRSKNVYGNVGKEGNFYFTVLSPWYFTWWAYLLYIFFIFSILAGIRKFELNRRQDKEERRILKIEHDRKTKELEDARALQLSMLPKKLPNLKNIEISAYMKTATEVGGDYYDFYIGEDGSLTVIVGDATGHGMNSGMMVTATKSLFQSFAGLPDLKQICSQMNTSLCMMNLQPMYMAVILMKVHNCSIELINAGMPDMLIYNNLKNLVYDIKSGGPPLGAFADYPFELHKSEISKDDVLLLMSDGFAERFNEQEEIINFERCFQILTEFGKNTPSEIIDNFIKKGDEWAGTKQPDDDITFVVLKHN